MRKYLAISVAFAFLMFMAAAMAQAGAGQPGGGQAGGSQAGAPGSTGSMGAQTEQPGGTQTEQPGATTSQEQGKTKGKSAGKAHTVEGCIVKEESDYFLVPKSGSPIMLQAGGTESPSGHEGHHVKVKGSEQPVSAAGGAGATGGAAGAAAGAQPTTGGQAGQAGAVGSQAGQAGMGAAGGGGQLHQNASKMIVADQITMVSESCPANWNSKYTGGGKTGPGGSSGSQGGSTQTPPPMF